LKPFKGTQTILKENRASFFSANHGATEKTNRKHVASRAIKNEVYRSIFLKRKLTA
jgi:hypothetical protein